MEKESQMGEVTQLAFNCINEDELIRNEELDPMDVLDYLQDGYNFKRVSDLLKETMIKAGIPENTKKLLEGYSTISEFYDNLNKDDKDIVYLSNSSPIDAFINSLFTLLSKQEQECAYKHRKYEWARPTISRWFSDGLSIDREEKQKYISIRNRDDAIAICFALALDYPSSRDFINKCGHSVFNIRNAEDAVYIYCLLNHRPLSVAKKLISRFDDDLSNSPVPEDKEITHTGNTTLLLSNQIMGTSDWTTDDSFYDSFMLPNMASFISYSRTALNEYYRIKNPVYLYALKKLIDEELVNDISEIQFKKRKIQEYIHKAYPDRSVDVPLSSVQITYNFINNLSKYSSSSDLLKNAKEMLKVQLERQEKGWHEDCFEVDHNIPEVIDSIISNYASYLEVEAEQKALSDFLSDTVTAYRMLCVWLPSIVLDDYDESGYKTEYLIDNNGEFHKRWKKKDSRQRSYNQSVLSDTVLRSFPHRNFFTQFERAPEKMVHDASIRKAIILLYYMNYARNLVQELSDPSAMDDVEFGFANFYRSLNEILGKCQLGKLYCANPFDWLILEGIKKLETNRNDEELENNPVLFLDDVLSLSFDDDE